MIDVQVSDGDETSRFVFWDNTLIELLGVTAAALQQNMIQVILYFHNLPVLFNISCICVV
jgi:hypothetical protein